MPEYRLYRLHPYSGHITSSEHMHESDDVAAVHAIQQRRFAVPVELWTGGRKVTRLDAPPERASSEPGAICPTLS
jgi:hypothetical protein